MFSAGIILFPVLYHYYSTICLNIFTSSQLNRLNNNIVKNNARVIITYCNQIIRYYYYSRLNDIVYSATYEAIDRDRLSEERRRNSILPYQILISIFRKSFLRGTAWLYQKHCPGHRHTDPT